MQSRDDYWLNVLIARNCRVMIEWQDDNTLDDDRMSFRQRAESGIYRLSNSEIVLAD